MLTNDWSMTVTKDNRVNLTLKNIEVLNSAIAYGRVQSTKNSFNPTVDDNNEAIRFDFAKMVAVGVMTLD